MHPELATVNPATGRLLATYAPMSPADIDRALEQAVSAQAVWAATPTSERAALLRDVGTQLRDRRAELAALVTAEMGKPVTEAVLEIDKCSTVCDYYADNAPRLLAPKAVAVPGFRSWVSVEPLGVVLAVMPWNFPFWQAFRFALPTLAAGNACVLKHAPNVTGCALAIQALFRDAGLPSGIFRALLVSEPDVPTTVTRIIEDPRVAAVTLTGSNLAGARVGAAAGRAAKKCVLELGGSDPFVVLEDANLDDVVPRAVHARFANAGQSCISAKRFIVQDSVRREFADRFARAVKDLTVGDPTDPATSIGPLARADLAENLMRQVNASVDAGAKILTGGHVMDRGPAWFAPAVLEEVNLDMPVMAEETFGPVATVIGFRQDDEAVALANATPYGLGASVWSDDPDRALSIGSRIQSGSLFVNAVVASDPRLPFGGTKASGFGRELGEPGALEFTNLRTVVVG